MGILSGFKKIEKYIKQTPGYQKISQWTSAESVEFNDGTILEDKIKLKADLYNPALTGTPTAPTPPSGTSTAQIATTAFVQEAVSNGIAASDALIFKGTIGTNGTITVLPSTYKTGWTYRVITEGIYAGEVCEVGDLIIALISREGTENENSDWCVAQTNINGAITGIKSGDANIICNQSGSTITVTHKDTLRTDVSSTLKPSAGGTFTAVKSIDSDTKGHVTGVETETITLPTLDATGLGFVSTGSSQKLTDTEKKNARDNIGAAPVSHASSATTYGVSTAANYGHAMASSTTPKANGTATVGSETAKFARGDHVHPLQTSVSGSSGSCTGNAATATKLATARTLKTNLASTAAANFDGSANITPGVTGTLPVANGGTGKATLTANQVLVGNGTSAISQRAIDTTAGGTQDSTALITSGAVYDGMCYDSISITGTGNLSISSIFAGENSDLSITLYADVSGARNMYTWFIPTSNIPSSGNLHLISGYKSGNYEGIGDVLITGRTTVKIVSCIFGGVQYNTTARLVIRYR